VLDVVPRLKTDCRKIARCAEIGPAQAELYIVVTRNTKCGGTR